jgi:3-phenylpropionate/trans-cinnamate dioxygenase ferredoxin component
MPEFRKAAAYADLEEGKITAVKVEDQRIALYRVSGNVLATCEYCTHDDCSLEDFGKIDGEEVECTCHGAKFRIKTGEVTRAPATVPLQIYMVKIEGDDVYVEI